MAQLLFNTKFTTKMHDIDAAGIVFFARFFYYAHDAYEQYLSSRQQSISRLMQTRILLPIIHSEADFKAPVTLNENIEIELCLREKRARSFSLEYRFINSQAEIIAIVRTIHVCMDSKLGKKVNLPVKLFD